MRRAAIEALRAGTIFKSTIRHATIFRRSILKDMKLEADGMAFSEEIKIEALKSNRVRFAEISILYTSRLGEIKLNPWRDGFYNLWFLVKKRFS